MIHQVWSPYLIKHITALENVQRRATKLIPGYKELDYKERLQRLNLPTISSRRLRGDMIEIYKILTGKYDSSVTSIVCYINGKRFNNERAQPQNI